MKKVLQTIAVVFSGAAAVIWAVRVVVDLVYGVQAISSWLVILDVFCALVWIVAFVVQFYRLRSGERKG